MAVTTLQLCPITTNYKTNPMKKNILFLAILAAALLAGHTVQAKVTLPHIFSDNMVVQQKSMLRLTGTARPLATVVVKAGWEKRSYTLQSNGEGGWSLTIPTPVAGGPYTLSFNDGEETILHNVMVGEVWFCSGQSNMEMPIAGWGEVKNFRDEIAAASHPMIRLFLAQKVTSLAPLDDAQSTQGGWQECSPATVPEFSALAYFYARELQERLHVAVGVINSSWGGTPAEAWTAATALEQVPEYKESVEMMKRSQFNSDTINAVYQLSMEEWKEKIKRIDQGFAGSRENWSSPLTDDSGWSSMKLPAYWEGEGLKDFDGVVWFRKKVEIPAEWSGKELQLNFGVIDDEDIVFWNGKEIARGSGYNVKRHYKVPASMVQAGENLVCVRVLDTGGEGGIAGEAGEMSITGPTAQALSTAGLWKYCTGCTMAQMPDAPLYPGSASYPTVLFNGMVHPWLHYPIRGVIWYQGCANVGRAAQYEGLFQTLITDWRKQFGNPQMPFYFVQLANYLERKEVQPDSPWAALRYAQSQALHLPYTGMVTNIDLGEANNIHPKNKQAVAKRLAAIALAHTYGQKVAASAPVYDTYAIQEEGKAKIFFKIPAHGENFAPNSDIKGFTIAGPDHLFYKAQAVTQGNCVIVSSPLVTTPIAIRYGWADNPECNLATPSGLQVAPFRTDNW